MTLEEEIELLKKQRDYWKSATKMVHNEHCNDQECINLLEFKEPK